MSDKPGDPPGGDQDRTIIQPGRPLPRPPGFPPAAAPAPGYPPATPAPGYPPPQQGYPPAGGNAPPLPSATPVSAPTGTPASAPGGPARLDFAAAEPEIFGPEPLLSAAGRFIFLASQVKMMPIGPDLNEFRRLVVRELEAFGERARALSIDAKTIQLARYILSAFMDDAVMSTPWGANSVWSQQSLLITYHNDAQGGDRLFDFAERMTREPDREPQLMELLYQCLSLGFEGRAALDPRGATLLNDRRARLAQTIASRRAALSGEISPQWHGVEASGGRYEPRVPLWVILSVLGVIALAIFSALLFRLSSQVDAALAALNQVVGTAQVSEAPPPPPEAKTGTFDTIQTLLQPDVTAGRLSVLNQGNDIVLRLNNQALFEPASAQPSPEWSETFARLAKAANLAKGPIRVEGHTDNQPLNRSLQFPSNLELSVARAKSVADSVIGAGLTDPSRLRTSGLADSQPIADNATAEGRRQNRRVELHVANDIAWK